MIDWLEIKQFAIAEQIEIEFDDQFTTVTGETGSGKSLIVDAIDFLVGHRSDSSYIKHDRDTAELQSGFNLGENHPAQHWLGENGLDNEGECILRRVLRRNKPSRSYINGHAATVTQLKELGKYLIDIHGQNEHHSLLQKSVQLKLVDQAAGNTETVANLGDHYESLKKTSDEIARIQSDSHASQERADMLKFQIDELDELAPKSGEWEELSASQKKLGHHQELTSGAREIADTLEQSEQDNISSNLLHCISRLEQLSRFDEEMKSIASMLTEAQLNVREAAMQLQPYTEANSLDPEEIERLESRFSLYHSLARKHRIQPGMLAEHLQTLKQELEGLANPEAEIERLEEQYRLELSRYQKLADSLTKSRAATANRLSEQVTSAMQELGLKGGKLTIVLQPVQDGRPTRYGNETIDFLVTANPGMPVQPMSKVASGGELSRISLAIQVVLADKSQVTTLIFDEVDVGIGGEVANVVGQKLRQLGETCQVICITHLSQVAARGNQQLRVTKNQGDRTETIIEKLSPTQRVEEIARMTGGDTITEQSKAHAQEMLRSA